VAVVAQVLLVLVGQLLLSAKVGMVAPVLSVILLDCVLHMLVVAAGAGLIHQPGEPEHRGLVA
jgi:hypothetical protein